METKWRLPTENELNKMYKNLFREGIGGFANDYYWSSSEDDSSGAWYQLFFDGYQGCLYKYDDARVRAVRAF